MIDTQKTWRDKYDVELLDLADSSTGSPDVYANAWADYMRNRVDALTGIAEDGFGAIIKGTTVAAPRLTFNRKVFFAKLLPLLPIGSLTIGATQFANAWEAAWLASILLYLPGDIVDPGGPTGIWSSITLSLILPPTIVLSKAFLIANLPLQLDVSTRRDSKWPIIFRDAVSVMQGTVTGQDSVVPIPGILTITAPLA